MLPKRDTEKGTLQADARYKGIFNSRSAPPSRAYCILFSFFFGVLLITLGAVFYNVILIQPISGMQAVHVPPEPIACTLVLLGIVVLLLTVVVSWKYGLDDGDDSLDDDKFTFIQDDVLDQHHRSTEKNLPI